MKTYFTQSFHLLLVIALMGLNVQSLIGQTNPNAVVYNSTINQDILAPIRLAADKMNNIFVSDASLNRVVKYDPSGNFIEAITTGGSPLSIAINLNDEVFIGEEEGKILKISGGTITNFYTDAIYPSDMDFSPDGKLYIVDSKNKRVIVLDENGTKIQEFGAGILLYPTCIAYDYQNQRIFVTEHGGTHGGFTTTCKVWVFNQAGVQTGSFGSGGNGNGKFYRMQGIDVGKCGNIYVNDPYQGKISVYNENLVFVTKFGVYGDSLSQLNLPMDVLFDSQVRILVTSANTSKIEVFNIVDTLPSSFIQYSESTINCAGQTREIPIHFTGTAPWTFTYTVDGINPTTVTTSDNPYIINATGPGIYEVVSLSDANFTGTCLTGFAKVNYDITTLPPTSTITSMTEAICEGETANVEITFTGSAPWTFTYTQDGSNPQTLTTSDNVFLLPVSEAGLYEITQLSADACPGSGSTGSAEIHVIPAPTAAFLEGNNQFDLCQGQSMEFNLHFSGTAPWSFTYTVDGQNPVTMSGINTNSYYLPVSANGTYQVIEISDSLCSSNVSQGSPVIIVHELPTATMTNVTEDICDGQSTPIYIDFSGDGPWTFSYQVDTLMTTTIFNTTTNPYIINAIYNGTYEIIGLTDTYCTGNSFSGMANITVSYPPISDFSYISNGLEISFVNNTMNASTYLWDFGDTQTSIDFNPIHTYPLDGTYIVTLTTSNAVCGDNVFTDTLNVYALGMENFDNENSITFYPTPTSGILYIKFLKEVNNEITIEIFNMAGEITYQEIYKSNDKLKKIDLSNISPGVYSIRFSNNKISKTQKLIISR